MGKKDSGIASLIAVIGGLFGFSGLGHIYAGAVGKGVLILILQWVLIAIALVLTFTFIFAIFAIPFFLAYIGIWIWQIFDAGKEAKKAR